MPSVLWSLASVIRKDSTDYLKHDVLLKRKNAVHDFVNQEYRAPRLCHLRGIRSSPVVGVTELGFIPELVAVFAAGFSAGAVNVVVGGGTLVSFPVLVLLGYPPVTATVANTVGIVPGSVVGAFGYRRELSARRKVMRALLPASVAGGVTGSLLLLSLPGEVFTRVVPWLICTGTMLVLLGPTVKRTVAVRRSRLRTASDGPGDGPGDGQGDGPGDGPGPRTGSCQPPSAPGVPPPPRWWLPFSWASTAATSVPPRESC